MEDDSAFDLTGFDRYVEEHGIHEEDYAATFALWITQRSNREGPGFEKVEEND